MDYHGHSLVTEGLFLFNSADEEWRDLAPSQQLELFALNNREPQEQDTQEDISPPLQQLPSLSLYESGDIQECFNFEWTGWPDLTVEKKKIT